MTVKYDDWHKKKVFMWNLKCICPTPWKLNRSWWKHFGTVAHIYYSYSGYSLFCFNIASSFSHKGFIRLIQCTPNKANYPHVIPPSWKARLKPDEPRLFLYTHSSRSVETDVRKTHFTSLWCVVCGARACHCWKASPVKMKGPSSSLLSGSLDRRAVISRSECTSAEGVLSGSITERWGESTEGELG